ncbi:phosphatase PAP2 family protein [Mycetocola zhadangensis]|uniref:phosphatase PAP2 family protein n=1 Tax=Mycetocola zhadangensis TaxID=1164595 RepID=UPI003A4D955D
MADPFTPGELTRPYPSDVTYPYESIMDSFNVLRNDPAIIGLNDAITIRFNTTTPSDQVDRAIVDQYADMSISMADGMGQNLGAIYAAGRENGELPKVEQLLAKEGGLIGYYSSSNPSKNFFGYDRPYIRLTASLKYHDKPGGDAWGSTGGSFPSGHTSQAYWQGTALAVMLPELAPQILARTSEASNNRVIMAAHYPLDVMSGRMMGNHITERRMTDTEFRPLIEAAGAELRNYLEAQCGDTLANCIAADTPYLSDDDSLAVYEERMTYGFPQIGASGQPVIVPANAESLLLTSHPTLTDVQRRQVLALTAIDSGYPLDEGNIVDGWQRLNLAAAMAADVVVNADGSVSLAGDPSTPPGTTPGGNPGTAPGTPGTGPADPGAAPATPGTVPAVAPTDADNSAAAVRTRAVADRLATSGSDFALPGLLSGILALTAGAGLLLVRRKAAVRS